MGVWANFYFLCGSAAAGLTGLVFVAVTFGSRFITEKTMSRVNIFFSPICFHFIEVFLLCCVLLIPTTTPTTLAALAFAAGLFRLTKMPGAFKVMKEASHEDGEIELSDWLLNVIFPTVIHCSLMLNGVLFYIQSAYARDLMAANLIGLLAMALYAAWEMQIWLASKIDDPPPKK